MVLPACRERYVPDQVLVLSVASLASLPPPRQARLDCGYNRLAVTQELPKVEIGDIIDNRYRICGILGQGGMGQVFKAEHVGIKRQVAIKLLHRDLRDDEATNERILREAFATGRLDHPNCVSIMDSGTLEDGATYLVMELLKGRSLGEELDMRGTMPIAEVLHIAKHVLQGLAHAHGVGVVHRDLKPDNIFLVKQEGEELVAKILDFGIAKLLGDAASESGGADLTQAGMAIGSPTYMSPEQATGGTLDGRSDLYSLSLVLFEMLTGEPPFFEEDNKVLSLQRRLVEDPPVMRAPSGATMPTGVELMIRAGLGRSMDERTASAEEYLSQVNAEIDAMADQDSDPTPESVQTDLVAACLPTPLPKKPARVGNLLSKENKQLLILAGAGAAVLLSLIIVASIVFGGSEDDAQVAGDTDDILEMSPDYLQDRITEDPAVMQARMEEKLVFLEGEVRAGRGAKSIKSLQRLQTLLPTNARVNRALGLAFMDKRYWQDGFKYFRKALALDTNLREDDAIIRAALRSLTSRSKPELGVRFLVRDIGEPAVPLLRKTAIGGSERQQEYARRALKQLGTEI